MVHAARLTQRRKQHGPQFQQSNFADSTGFFKFNDTRKQGGPTSRTSSHPSLRCNGTRVVIIEQGKGAVDWVLLVVLACLAVAVVVSIVRDIRRSSEAQKLAAQPPDFVSKAAGGTKSDFADDTSQDAHSESGLQ